MIDSNAGGGVNVFEPGPYSLDVPCASSMLLALDHSLNPAFRVLGFVSCGFLQHHFLVLCQAEQYETAPWSLLEMSKLYELVK